MKTWLLVLIVSAGLAAWCLIPTREREPGGSRVAAEPAQNVMARGAVAQDEARKADTPEPTQSANASDSAVPAANQQPDTHFPDPQPVAAAAKKFDPRFVQPATRWAPPPPTEADRQAQVRHARAKSDAAQAKAIAWAKANGMPIAGRTPGGGGYELMDVDGNGVPVYFATQNQNAAISTGVTPWFRSASYNLRGAGWRVGVWDAGPPRSTHREFFDGTSYRAIFSDSGAGPKYNDIAFESHATHVAGTIVARGVDANATGMAPDATAICFDWNGNISEMIDSGAAAPGDPGKFYVSNHSYGTIAGWANYSANPHEETHESGWHWIGVAGESAPRGFGRYNVDGGGAEATDVAARMRPYHLPFVAAGNDRGQEPGFLASVRWPKTGGGWNSGTYGLLSGAPGEDGGDSGYDTVLQMGIAKNVMTVGNLEDAVDGGTRSTDGVDLVSSSGIGPADDGRIKPDIVANGQSLYSPDSGSDAAYGTKTGTSMATPNAAGSALLLHELYHNFTGQYLRASTLKGLIIHTATDLGAAGPDYRTGWGLMDAGKAMDQIILHYNEPGAHHIVEAVLDDTMREYRLNFKVPPGTVFIWATLCWTDVAGEGKLGLDDRNANLVNDLDLRLVASNGVVHSPLRLSATNPSGAATFGDNDRDTVEKVGIAFPSSVGTYELVVNYKGALQVPRDNTGAIMPGGSAQVFSLILSGNAELDSGTVAEALDQPETQNFAFSGNRTWAFESNAAANDGDRVTSLPVADNTTVAFNTTVTGAQTVTFDWGVSSEAAYDKLRFLVDDVLVSQISGEVATTAFVHAITTGGTHVLRWEYTKDVDTATGQDRGWVDQLLFNNLPEAVDDITRAYSVVPGSGVPWALENPGSNDYATCRSLGIDQFSTFKTTLQGPAVVAFRMARTGSYGDLFCSYGPVLGRTASSTVRGGVWEDFQIQLDPGPQEVHWTFRKQNPGGGASNGDGAVDRVVVIPEPVTLLEALGFSEGDQIPVLSGRGAWVAAHAAGAPIDVDRQDNIAAVTALTVDGQPVHLMQRFLSSAGGLFSFWWRASGPGAASMAVNMRSSLGGALIESLPFVSADVPSIFGGTGWQQGFIEVPPGVTEVRFTYTPSGSSGQGGLDRFRFQPNAQHPARGLDRWTSRWETMGDTPWHGAYDSTNGGLDSATHGDIGDNQSASLTTTIIGPKLLTFSWKVSSEAGFDFLGLMLDGEAVDAVPAISGNVPWTAVEVPIPAGPHTLRWVYQKDESVSESQDAGWLDGVAVMRPDYGIDLAPLGTELHLIVRKDPWTGYRLEESFDLTTWTQTRVFNTRITDFSTLIPNPPVRKFYRLRFSPEQMQPLENAGFELPATAAGSFNANGPGWGPDNDGATTTSFEYITGFAWAGTQHLSIAQGAFSQTNATVTLYPGRHSLTAAIGRRAGFTDANNRTVLAITNAAGADLALRSTNAFNIPAAGTFVRSYPVSYSFTSQQFDSLPVTVKLTSPGTGRSHFDDVHLVSEPQ